MNIDTAFKKRRSRYDLSREATLSDASLVHLLEDTLKHTPSPYNAQHQRAVLLLNQQHDALWEIVLKALKEKTKPEKFSKTKEKIEGFAKSYGTVLFFDDTPTIDKLQDKFPSYKDQFALWAQQSQGMFQYAVWTQLAAQGIGASLQHYNPLIDAAVHDYFNIPKTWKLAAQMPFGIPTGLPKDKAFMEIKERYMLKK